MFTLFRRVPSGAFAFFVTLVLLTIHMIVMAPAAEAQRPGGHYHQRISRARAERRKRRIHRNLQCVGGRSYGYRSVRHGLWRGSLGRDDSLLNTQRDCHP